MTVVLPTKGEANWDIPLNLALADLQNQVDAVEVDFTKTPKNVMRPVDQGVIAWSYDPAIQDSSGALANGVLGLTRISITETGRTLNNIIGEVSAAGVDLVVGQNFAGLYNSAGQRLAITADQTTNWQSTGLKVMPVVAPVVLPPGLYWVAVISNTATTIPSFRRSSASAVAAAINIGQTGGNTRFGSWGVGQTTLPGTINTAIINQSGSARWVAIS